MSSLQSNSPREYKYDYIRAVSMIAIITIHVSQVWANNIGMIENGNTVKEFVSCSFNTLSRFGVPCFIMLSGAFLLDNNENANYSFFYRKEFVKIFIPTILFSILYLFYRALTIILGGGETLIGILEDACIGKPMYHMWYLYSLIGLYALTPVCIRFKNSISEASFRKVAIVFFILIFISRNTRTGDVTLYWDVSISYDFLGYYMIGYIIRKDIKENKKGVFFLFCAMIVGMIASYMRYNSLIQSIDNKLLIPQPYSMYAVPMSILLFAGIASMNLKSRNLICILSNKSFIIYLLHAGVWDVFRKVIKLIGVNLIELNCCIYIPLFVIAVLIVSLLLSGVFQKIVEQITKLISMIFIN